MIQVEAIETPEQLSRLEPEWHALEEASGNAFPFRAYEWTWAWWKHLSQRRRAVKDSLFVRALRGPQGELLAVAPLLLTERPGVGPARLRALQFVGPDGYITEVGGILCAPGFEREAYRTLALHLGEHADRWDWMLWSGLQSEGESWRAVEAVAPIEWQGGAPNYVLDLPSTWEDFRSALPRNMKEALRKCYNSPKRHGLDFRFEIARTEAGMAPALEDFFQLHTARARLEGTVRHKDFFTQRRARDFLTEVCTSLARRGATRIFALKLGGATVATRIGFVFGKTLYLYYSGYDPAYRAHSVMTTTVAEAIRAAIAEGLGCVNLSMGNDVSKTRWRPREAHYAEARQLSTNAAAQVWFRLYRQMQRVLRGPLLRAVARRYVWRSLD